MSPRPDGCAAETQVPSEHKPNEPTEPDQTDQPDQTDEAEDERAWEEALLRARGQAPGGSDKPRERAQTDDERAWEQALLRARGEFSEEDTDVVGKNHSSGPAVAVAAASPTALAPQVPPAMPDRGLKHVAEPPPIELTHVLRKRRPTRPDEPVLPAQQVTVRGRRQTGSMSLAMPTGEAGRPVDLEPAAPGPAAPEAAPSPPPSAPTPLDGGARSRERSREREALERVLALAKPRTRQTRATPAVLLPPLPDDDGDDSDDGGREG